MGKVIISPGMIKKIKNELAITQDGSTATVAISEGQYINRKGSIYRAKADIAIGDSFSSSNIEAPSSGALNILFNEIDSTSQAIGSKAEKDDDAVAGNFASFDSSGNPVDSGHKHSDYITSHQDISGKADKVTSATSGNFAGLDSNGNLTDSGHKHSDYITSHQDISGKADKVASATSGNFAALDGNGNLTDSGHSHSDYLTQHQDISGKLDIAQGSGNSGKFMCVNSSGNVVPTEVSDMVILSYGNSTWNDFISAYNKNHVVYCRASSNSNPATGSQTRLAFMAYVDNATSPTNVEFQYYRSVNSHSASQQGDQVYVYKLTSASGGTWTVTVREAYTKIVAGTNMTSSYSNGALTLNAQSTTYSDFSGATSLAAGAHGLVPAPASGDQDKVLKGDGTWGTVDALPAVTSSDNGKFLVVVNGAWAAATMAAWQGGSY